MNATDVMAAPSTAAPPRPAGTRPRGGIPWARVALACAVLAAAGGARHWQERRFRERLDGARVAPFPLKGLPMAVGSWRVPGGREEELEPAVVGLLNCSDYLRRHYVD